MPTCAVCATPSRPLCSSWLHRPAPILAGAGLDWHVLAKVIEEAGSPQIAPFDWSEVADFDPDHAAPARHREPKPDSDAPDAPSRRGGLPIWGVKKIEPWWVIAGYCLQMDWALPKPFGGKSLTKADKDRLRAVQRLGPTPTPTPTGSRASSLGAMPHGLRGATEIERQQHDAPGARCLQRRDRGGPADGADHRRQH